MCTHRLHTYNIYPYLTIFSFNNRNISRKIYKRKVSLSLSRSLSLSLSIKINLYQSCTLGFNIKNTDAGKSKIDQLRR